MRVIAKNGVGGTIGKFVIPKDGKAVEVPKDIGDHGREVLTSWVKMGLVEVVEGTEKAAQKAQA